MGKLYKSGLPLYLDEDTNVMALSALLQCEGFGRKQTGQMIGLLADEGKLAAKEQFYDVYRGIAYPEDVELLQKYDYRYDITVIMPGLVNGECKKTSGHYHGYNPQRTNTYAEVYEVIKGTALYILQKSNNFDTAPENIKLQDVILVTVQEGETIIIPPNYGHASVNIGEGPLIFSNLAYISCPVLYGAVKQYHGMSYYVKKEGKEVIPVLNGNYKKTSVPKPKFASVKENPKLGIKFGIPVYESFKSNPAAFDFLANPDNYVDEIMDMLIMQ